MSLPKGLGFYVACSVLLLSLGNFHSMLAYSVGDVDGDGIPDDLDNCRFVSNPNQLDTDHDGRGDACDPFPNDPRNDADGDGISGDIDNCPNVSNPDQLDTDDDDRGNVCDSDDDNDGILDGVDNCQFIVNAGQEDDDGDGIGNVCDPYPNDSTNGADTDADGVPDILDNCPTLANPLQEDTDGDGTGNVCDPTPNGDTDGDGIDNLADNCPAVANPGQEDADSDGLGNACDSTPNGDDDNDGIDNLADNCPAVANPGQEDNDHDGLGNVCDSTPNGNDTTPPEAYNQFDPVTKNVLVFGRDDGSGVPSGPISPISVIPISNDHGDDDGDKMKEIRTYKIFDAAGNSLTLVEKVKKERNEIKVNVVSIQYNDGPVIIQGKNKKSFEWSTNKDGTIKELNQKMKVGKDGTKQKVDAKFDAKKNKTTITVEKPKPEIKMIKDGLVLLRMATHNGNLVIEYLP